MPQMIRRMLAASLCLAAFPASAVEKTAAEEHAPAAKPPAEAPALVVDATTGKVTQTGGAVSPQAPSSIAPMEEAGGTDVLDRDATLAEEITLGPGPETAHISMTRSAGTAAAAKQQAQALAQRNGLRKILESQTPGRASAILAAIAPEKVAGLVAKFSAANEQSTVTTYRADLTIQYDAKALQALLGAPLKPLPEAPPPPPLAVGAGRAALLIPVWVENGQMKLWEPENPWRRAAGRAALQESKGKLVLPYGDPADQLAISPAKILTLNYSDVAELTRRYGTAEVLVVQAAPVAANSVDLTLTHITAEGRRDEKQLVTLPEGKEGGRDALLSIAASTLAQLARQQFQTTRQAEVQATGARHTIRALAPVTRAADWVTMRKRLLALPMVEALDPLEIAPEKVEMNVTFHGTAEAFGAALKSAGIHVTSGPGKLLLGFYPIPN